MNMINSLVIEVPKSLLLSNPKVNGANKISAVLIQLIIEKYADKDIVIVSDGDQEDFDYFLKRQSQARSLIHARYQNLGLLLQEKGLSPDLGFVSDLNSRALIEFRNYFRYGFPIVSLIHSLGTYHDFMLLKDIWGLMGSADMLICPSPSTQETAMNLGVFKNYTCVINYGVDLEKFTPKSDYSEIRKHLKIGDDKKVISIISRINPYMKMDMMPLLRILPDIVKKYPSTLLMIVGVVQVPDYVDQLKSWIDKMGLKEAVMWVEAPDQACMEQYYQASDIFLSLSDNSGETFGLTILEAMATGKAIVLSDISGYKVHIEDGKDGVYIPTYSGEVDLDPMFYSQSLALFGDAFTQSVALDLPKLRAEVCRLLEDKELRLRLGNAARRTVEERNTYKNMSDDYVACFEHVAKKAKDEGLRVPENRIENISNILGHFTSQRLGPDTRLKCSNYGLAVFQKKEILFSFHEHVNRYAYVSHILSILNSETQSLECIQKKLELDRSTIDANLLYMLKHNLVEIT